MTHSEETFLIQISGLVQGVGFRPFVWRLANELGVEGCVFNDGAGVRVHANVSQETLHLLIGRLTTETPPLARVDEVNYRPIESACYRGFSIVASQTGEISTGCAPDAATCLKCQAELFDPNNRRYRYPFINCTDCGPRLSIIRQIPYDRPYTTMAEFKQCKACLDEYCDPADRRFHAQPNACAECGPKVWLETADGKLVTEGDCFLQLTYALQAGQIIAIKGLGGFHLVCDATSHQAVALLRARKHRPEKAFALMVRDEQVLRQYADPNSSALALISSSNAPVVLLDPVSNDQHAVAQNVAPGQYQLGFMLPYTPIHHLLLEHIDTPLVMTSGNRSGSPQAISNEDARAQLLDIADLFLMHDRPIQNRVDDSVVRDLNGEIHVLRRARGYAPGAMPLPPGFENAPDLVALGGELKNTLCLLQAGRAIISQHLGDLEDFQTYEQYQKTLELYLNLYQHGGERYVCDLHPEYLSSKFGENLQEQGKELLRVQHHHAHMAACLGENQFPLQGGAVLGICLDGTGFGLDDTLWGGEFLLGGYQHINRVAHLKPFPLIGGVKAIVEPWRCLYAQLSRLSDSFDNESYAELFPQLASPLCTTFEKMIEKGLNVPMTSSAGRLFDAVAAALGCHPEQISYEGQAAIELETLAKRYPGSLEVYPFAIAENQIDPTPFWQALITDLQQAQPDRSALALKFHHGFAAIVVEMVLLLREQHSFSHVALSGGVMQNEILFTLLRDQLAAEGFTLLTHHKLPANDGSLSFGQALVAASRLL